MNANAITMGMTPQEKEIYFAHMEKRHREEAEKLEYERQRLRAYKENMIEEIIKHHPQFKIEELRKIPIRTIERIFDHL